MRTENRADHYTITRLDARGTARAAGHDYTSTTAACRRYDSSASDDDPGTDDDNGRRACR